MVSGKDLSYKLRFTRLSEMGVLYTHDGSRVSNISNKNVIFSKYYSGCCCPSCAEVTCLVWLPGCCDDEMKEACMLRSHCGKEGLNQAECIIRRDNKGEIKLKNSLQNTIHKLRKHRVSL